MNDILSIRVEMLPESSGYKTKFRATPKEGHLKLDPRSKTFCNKEEILGRFIFNAHKHAEGI